MWSVVTKIRNFTRRHAMFNWLLQPLLPRYGELAVRGDTQLVIEGFPRCANSFSVMAFEMCQPKPVRIAHHLHSIGQVKRGILRGIPCLILIRHPRDAVLSYAVRIGARSLAPALEEYVDFYSAIRQWRDRVVIADFPDVTSDLGEVIGRLNRRFGTDFQKFEHTDENVRACYERLDQIEQRDAPRHELRHTHVARPSPARKELAEALANQLELSPAGELLLKAEGIYHELVGSPDCR